MKPAAILYDQPFLVPSLAPPDVFKPISIGFKRVFRVVKLHQESANPFSSQTNSSSSHSDFSNVREVNTFSGSWREINDAPNDYTSCEF